MAFFINLPYVLKLVNHRITGVWEYGWKCYGVGATAYNLRTEHADITCIINAAADVVKLTVTPPLNSPLVFAYRWIDPSHEQNYRQEARSRNVSADQAWDEIDYVDLPEEAMLSLLDTVCGAPSPTREYFDWLNTTYGIDEPTNVNNDNEEQQEQSLEDDVTFTVSFEKDILFDLMLIAHDKDITLNQLISQILIESIDRKKFGE